MRIFFPLFIALLLISLGGCVDEITIDTDPPEDPPLVVAGGITDGPGPHEVRLSRAGAFEQSLEGIAPSVEGALVAILEEDTNRFFVLNEQQRGVYATAPGQLVGVPGRTYSLQVVLPDETRYVSDPETMPAPVAIDSLYAELNTRGDDDVIDVRVNFQDEPNERQYYRWSTRATFETPVLPEPMNPPFYCWADGGASEEIPVTDDQLFDGQRREGQLIRPVPISRRTGLGYQLDVEQLTLTRDAYSFWEQVEEQVENVGSIFSPPPSPIFGNVRNLDDPTDRALGYFSAAGKREETICLYSRDFENATPVSIPNTNDCDGPRVSFQRPSFWQCTSSRN